MKKITTTTVRKPTNVFEYFVKAFGIQPWDETFRDIPLDSVVGQACKETINTAMRFYKHTHNAVGDEYIETIADIAFHTCQIFWRS